MGQPKSREALARVVADIEPVLWRGEGARPARIKRARRVVREVEVEDHGSCRDVSTEVRALGRVEQVAAGSVRLRAVRAVAKGQKEPARVARYPEQRQGPVAAAERDDDRPDPRERELVWAAARDREGAGAGCGSRGRLDADVESQRGVIRPVSRAEGAPAVGRDRRLGMLAKQTLAHIAPVTVSELGVFEREPSHLRVQGRKTAAPVGQAEAVWAIA